MNWIELNDIHQLDDIRTLSYSKPQVIFKHSTRCSISVVAKSRLERVSPPEHTDFYFLDLIRYRSISNKIETDFAVPHESPQVLLIINGECVYEESHGGIRMEDVAAQIV
ncbi:MAG TPA: bacillithiol system redox-active protein YtxJ [Ferruginibacter sp.]|nr:bacillithiol system redox-active protein YtxJ [Ferruginibacter sp.]